MECHKGIPFPHSEQAFPMTQIRRIEADARGKPRFLHWSRPSPEGDLNEGIETLDLLIQQGSYVRDSVFYSILKRCNAQKNLTLGARVHALAVRSGYESNKFLANHFICMYAFHGRLEEARQVFNKVPGPSRFMWSSIILAHARHGQPLQAIELYRSMRESAVKPDDHIFAAALQACGTARDLLSGRQVHADILGTAHNDNVFVGTCLVDMYAKCGSLEDAQRVFDNLPTKDVVTWNAMIIGYAQHGLGTESLTLFVSMQQEGITSPDYITFVCLLQVCASIRDLHRGKHLHMQIQERGLQTHLSVGNCLVDMYAKCERMDSAQRVFDNLPTKNVVTWTAMIAGYAKCGSLAEARRLFDNLPTKNVVTWNAMIGGYAQHGLGQEALTLYGSMQQEVADAVTFVCVLQACASMRALHQGKQLHAQIQERGLEADKVVANSLVNMYVKCGNLQDACRMFERLQSRDVVTWNAMIAGHVQNGLAEEAFTLYGSMQKEGIAPTDGTFVCLLQACSIVGALHQGKLLHVQIEERGLGDNVAVANCLINMYSKCRSLDYGRRLFDNLTTRDVVTWNTMIAGYVHHGLGQEALILYETMCAEGTTRADAVTFLCLLQACNSVAGLEKGKEIHAEISKIRLECTELSVANALVDMYGKCGSMLDAQQVFDAVSTRDIVTWGALLAGYARQADSESVFHYFRRMMQEGIQPNGITFLSILTVCSHLGLLSQGQKYFKAMHMDFGISPTIQHYGCMVDLLSRAGQVHKAMQMVNTMPFQAPAALWRCVLSACLKWSNVEVGRQAFECAIRLDENDAAAYILMSNLYAAADMQEEAKDIEARRLKSEAWKKPGQSWWTDSGGIVHMFVVGDAEQLRNQDLYANLRDIFIKMNEGGVTPCCKRCLS